MTDRVDEIIKEERKAGKLCGARCLASRFCIGQCIFVVGHPLPPTGTQHRCRKHFEEDADAYARQAIKHD